MKSLEQNMALTLGQELDKFTKQRARLTGQLTRRAAVLFRATRQPAAPCDLESLRGAALAVNRTLTDLELVNARMRDRASTMEAMAYNDLRRAVTQ